MGRIIDAVRSVVPTSMWGRSSASWIRRSSIQSRSTSARTPSAKLMDAYDPTEFAEEDDEL